MQEIKEKDGLRTGMSYNFQTQLSDSRQKEANELVKNYWLGYGCEVNDVSENSEYFYKGIDLIRTLGGSSKTNIDVKCDFLTDLTGNIAFELIEIASENKNIKLGWAYGGFVDEIHYVIWNAKVMFILPLKEVRKIVFANALRGYASHHDKPFFYYTLGILIPIKELEQFERVQL